MRGIEPTLTTAENYRRFGEEAAGRSTAYGELALAVAEDDAILSFLAGLPPAKRQPNLLFAAATLLLGRPPDHASLGALIEERGSELAAVMRTRRTQTNEPARCAILLPTLAALAQPLALLEVGAAAGLTLLPDRYSYDYAGHRIAGRDPDAPTLHCRPLGPIALPDRVPEVVWRAGIDLHPLDVRSEDDVAWLRCLLWPGEPGRSERLALAVAAARRCPVPIHRGDLLDELHAVAAQAPAGATLVVYHTAVLAYVGEAKRMAFAAAVRDLGAVWLSNEGPGVIPGVAASTGRPNGFLLVRDGSELLAIGDSHGIWIEAPDLPPSTG